MRAVLTVVALLIAVVSADALTLDEYMNQVRAKHRGLQALDQSKEASTLRRAAGDIELSPILKARASMSDDRKPQPFGTILMDRTEVTEYYLGLAKKFSTGTQAEIFGQLDDTKTTATDLSSTPPRTLSAPYGTGSLGISLSQSLWKDAFGNGTRLRQERQFAIEANERQSYDLQAIRVLVDSEAAFWDYLYLKDELAARQDSLDRAKKIETWIRRRVGNGIGDEADLFNAQGLAASRELQLQGTQTEIRSAEKHLRDALELQDGEPTPDIRGDISISRSLDQMAQGKSGRRIRLDSYLAVLEAKTRAISARETEDAYRPDLVLSGKYNTNSSESTLSEATKNISQTNRPTSSVALTLSWALDGGLKDAARGSARSESLAAALRQERALLESDSAWAEMQRRHNELTKQIETAVRVDDLQNKKAAAQRNKLSKGRSITSDVILAEQDAAEARLTLHKLRAEQRKLEAQGRLFVTMEDGK